MQPPNRDFVMVAEVVRDYFDRRWREIDRDWQGGAMTRESVELWPDVAVALNSARDALRAEVRAVAPNFPGPYLVPV